MGSKHGVMGLRLFIACLTVAVCAWSGVVGAQEPQGPSPIFGCYVYNTQLCMTEAEYTKAGLFGTFLGFGSGYIMTGETARGVGFLITEGLLVAIIATGVLLFVDVIPMDDAMSADFIGGIMYIGGSAILLAVRIWEKVDVWKRPRHIRVKHRTGAEPWRHDPGHYRVALTPILAPTPTEDRDVGLVGGLAGRF
jgi:hypothetical protein